MTIHQHHQEHLVRLSPFYKSPMLVLGATGIVVPQYKTAAEYFGQWIGAHYEELDLDGGDLGLDLNEDIGLSQSHATVFNIGTIEHVWNAHNAWANALRAVRVGGHFITHGPINGWVNHGIHGTNPAAIRAFITKNGYTIRDEWSSQWRNQGECLWLAARKDRHIESLDDYEPALQVYEGGKKSAIR